MTLSVADTTSSPSAATPSQPDLEESLNLNSVKKMPASKVVNVEVHDESFSNFVRKDRKDLDESAIVTSPEITKVTNTSQDAIGEILSISWNSKVTKSYTDGQLSTLQNALNT